MFLPSICCMPADLPVIYNTENLAHQTVVHMDILFITLMPLTIPSRDGTQNWQAWAQDEQIPTQCQFPAFLRELKFLFFCCSFSRWFFHAQMFKFYEFCKCLSLQRWSITKKTPQPPSKPNDTRQCSWKQWNWIFSSKLARFWLKLMWKHEILKKLVKEQCEKWNFSKFHFSCRSLIDLRF